MQVSGQFRPTEKGDTLNDYEAKQEARRRRLSAAADRAEAASGATLKRAMDMIAIIPPGQPILVGHHSEKGHRALLKRHDGAMRRSSELSKLAKKLRDRADGVGGGGISSDDPDAVTKLDDKRTELERQRDWMKDGNAYYKAHGTLDGWTGPENVRRSGESVLRNQAYYQKPFPPYALSNIGARIRDAKKRTQQIEKTRSIESATETVGDATIITDAADNRIILKFPARLDRESYKMVRRYGFVWSPTRGGFVRKLSTHALYSARAVASLLVVVRV